MMTHLTLIVPFSVPPGAGDDATDDVVPGALLRQLELPALGKLLTRATPGQRERHDDPWLRSLPHERWLAGKAGLDTGRVPMAPYMRLADSGGAAPAGDEAWTCLQLVHIHAARDHLVLMHPDQLRVRDEEAASLYAAIEPLLREADITLETPNAARWYLPEAVFGPLDATTPLRATGRNIDIWLQAGERARDWRRLQNEIQMTWFDHPVNQAREAAGELPINSVWLYGGGAMQPVTKLADAVLTSDPFLTGLGLAGGSRVAAMRPDLRACRPKARSWRCWTAPPKPISPRTGACGSSACTPWMPTGSPRRCRHLATAESKPSPWCSAARTTLPNSRCAAPTCASSGAAWASAATGARCCPTSPTPPEPHTQKKQTAP